jgi:hypothetical protein
MSHEAGRYCTSYTKGLFFLEFWDSLAQCAQVRHGDIWRLIRITQPRHSFLQMHALSANIFVDGKYRAKLLSHYLTSTFLVKNISFNIVRRAPAAN